jgi:hypothetical protein
MGLLVVMQDKVLEASRMQGNLLLHQLQEDSKYHCLRLKSRFALAVFFVGNSVMYWIFELCRMIYLEESAG